MKHSYQVVVEWTGNSGQGTKEYRSYERSHAIKGEGKTEILGSSDPAFRGDPKKWNPEELLLSSVSSCHMLWYLHLCATNNIVVVEYIDRPTATMVLEPGGEGRITEAVLNPSILITDQSRIKDAEKLHHEAHEKCFIANSINFPVKIVPKIRSE